MHFLPIFLLIILPIQTSLGCFSRGGGQKPSEGNPEAQGLKAFQTQDDAHVEELNSVNDVDFESHNNVPAEQDPDLEPEFLAAYLKEFGYLRKGDDLSQGVKNFQKFLGLNSTGKVDLPTLQKMSWKRCANTDEGFIEAPQIWERDTLFWNLNSPPPPQFTINEMKELINQAFRAWEIVIAMDFLETQDPDAAQILFTFKSPTNNAPKEQKNTENNKSAKTGLAVASATSPPLSHIVISNSEHWSTFQFQEEGKLDIFMVLIHQIGHALGLKHSGDHHSVMFPMFERAIGEQLPVISNDDVERLRALYALFGQENSAPKMRVKRENVLCCTCPVPRKVVYQPRTVVPIDKYMEMLGRKGTPPPPPPPLPITPPPMVFPMTKGDQRATTPSIPRPLPTASAPPQLPPNFAADIAPMPTKPQAQQPEVPRKAEKCPHSITTVTMVNPDTLFVFNEGYAWHYYQNKLVRGPYKISEFFPDGPDVVDVAFSSGRLTVLLKSRMLFGYEFDPQTGQFMRDRRYPRELHSRIIFYPQASFPIANGSIILIQDDVFATYNVESNTPHMLGSVSEFFPGLPQELRSGFPASRDFATYYMLTQDYAFLYDARSARSISSQTIGQFLGCDPPPKGSVTQPMPQPMFPPKQLRPDIPFERPQQTQFGMGPPGAQQNPRFLQALQGN